MVKIRIERRSIMRYIQSLQSSLTMYTMGNSRRTYGPECYRSTRHTQVPSRGLSHIQQLCIQRRGRGLCQSHCRLRTTINGIGVNVVERDTYEALTLE